ncbi:hypothetical protein BDAP_001531 [Binucleata daphniae]
MPEFNDEEIKYGFLEVSKMSIIVPNYRMQYINDNYIEIKKIIENKKLDTELHDTTFTVMTNTKTRDPYILIKAHEFINLLARGVDIDTASKVLDDKYTSEIVKISNLCANKDTFINRRNRLEGPNGNTIKAIKLITKTEIFVQGKTVCIIGEYKRVREAIDIVEGCFKNLHPVYMIKKLMVKRELEKDKEMENVDWKRFLPEVKTKMKNKRGDGKKKKSSSKNNEDIDQDKIVDEEKQTENNKRKETNKTEESDKIEESKNKNDKQALKKRKNKKEKIYEAPNE